MNIRFCFFLWICCSVLFVACDDDEVEPNIVLVADIVLNRSELSLEVGTSEALEVIITPDNATNKKVTWKSTNLHVATVDMNGKVTALKAGLVTILVVTEDGAKIATCSVVCGGEDIEPDIAIVGIELNKNTLSLKEGESETLEAIITPNNATNKKVTWVSNDENVAVVDSNGKVTAIQSGNATVVAVTENSAKTASCEVVVEPGVPSGNRTVLVYVAADNSLSSFASLDLKEMKVGMGKVKDANAHFLVYIDNGISPRLLELKNKGGEIIETVVKTYEKRNSVGVSETQEVFADVFSNPKFQADSYGLVYWSHGDGWVPYPLRFTRWVGQDKDGGNDNRMNISDLVTILDAAPHLEFILFDACFMQSIEVAYELRYYTNYYIGSPTEIPGPGASYDEVVPAMFSVGNTAERIAQSYYEPYAVKYDKGNNISNSNWTGGASVCVLNTEKLVHLAEITKQVLSGANNKVSLRTSVFDYDRRRGSDGYQDGHVGYYDLADMMRMLIDDSAYIIWKQAFDAAVVSWFTTPMNYSAYARMFSMEGTNGVSCYIPSTTNNSVDRSYNSMGWYQAAGLAELGW